MKLHTATPLCSGTIKVIQQVATVVSYFCCLLSSVKFEDSLPYYPRDTTPTGFLGMETVRKLTPSTEKSITLTLVGSECFIEKSISKLATLNKYNFVQI